MRLCDSCGQPLALHVGYDHGARRCLLAARASHLAPFCGGEARAREILREAEAWYAQQQQQQQGGPGG